MSVQRLSLDEQARMDHQRRDADERQRQPLTDSNTRGSSSTAARAILSAVPSASSAASPGGVVEPNGTIATEMKFIPRPETVTDANHYETAESDGHPAVPWALCEYIDNALAALRKAMENESGMQPAIKLLFVEPTGEYAQSKKLHILIRSVPHSHGC